MGHAVVDLRADADDGGDLAGGDATGLPHRRFAHNILTPLNYQFPLVLAFSARYVRGVGLGTIISLCLPIAAACFLAIVLLLAAFWVGGVPPGLHAPYLYP